MRFFLAAATLASVLALAGCCDTRDMETRPTAHRESAAARDPQAGAAPVAAAPARRPAPAARPAPVGRAPRLHLIPPTTEELPVLVDLAPHPHQGTVGVEGAERPPRLVLTGDFTEPPLTPEEKRALGEEEPYYRPLLYEAPRAAGSLILPYSGGQEVAIAGMGGSDVGSDRAMRGVMAWGWGAQDVGISRAALPTGNLYDQVPTQTGTTPEAWLGVGYDRPPSKARAKPYIEE